MQNFYSEITLLINHVDSKKETIFSPFKDPPSSIEKQIVHIANRNVMAQKYFLLRDEKQGSLVPSCYPETSDKLVVIPGVFI